MANYNSLCKSLNILKFDDYIKVELATFMYELGNGMAPQCIQTEFESEPRPYNTRN